MKYLNKSQSTIPTLSHNGQKANDDLDKANMLNIFFADCFNTGLKIRFPILGNVQCRAKFHVDFSETEGNVALYCTISLLAPHK